jgi:prepilin-type N-terminal cleavage/methylation domain-containing protein/prepilin-type processing-associated H-X9-DG protein
MTPLPRRRAAFSLVELLTVIAIIAVLVGLLLPAVQSARESSRRSSCANNLKQLALGCLSYDSSQGHFPSGGWAWQWTGDPDAGLGPQQPGGWAFQVLPFIEQESIFEMGGDGVAPRGSPFNRANSTAQKEGAVARARTPVAAFVCPSRRGVGPLRSGPFSTSQNAGSIVESAGLDYAGNAGSGSPFTTFGNNNSWTDANYAVAADTIASYKPTGVIFPASQVQAAKIRDGLSVTFLLGEFNRHPENYSVAEANPFGGVGWSTSLNGLQADSANVPGVYPASGYNFRPFGSAHASTCHFAFCDGSVRPIAYDIQPTVRGRLCNRADGQLLDLDGL